MKRKLFLVLTLLLALGFQTNAQTTRNIVIGTAESAGMSTQRLKRLDAAMTDWVNKGWMPGGVGLIIKNGKVAYYKAIGYNDLESKTPLQKDGIFRIASQTKAVTTVAALILYDEGKLLLNDPVSKFIPSFRKQKVLSKLNEGDSTYSTVAAKREVTIKDLMTHTSGLGYAQIGSKDAKAIYAKAGLTAGLGVTNESLLDAMSRLGTLPLMHQPGERHTYGLNTDVLGCIVELISGMSLDAFFRTRIFEPLGMKDTYFQVPSEKASRLVNLYTEMPGGKLFKSPGSMLNGASAADYPLRASTYYSGGAGLSSTIYDYAIFLQMLLNEGEYNGHRILGKNTVRIMTSHQIGDINRGTDDDYGLGFQIVSEKGSAATPASIGTYSWGGAFKTSYWVDPKEKMVYLFYRQLQNTTHQDVVEKFRILTYQALN